ncbi:MAG: RsmD family RNA methyltransferase [Aquificota bacterium]|nr:RsmD family RNA methyltransferase [Aquificota bacterium]
MKKTRNRWSLRPTSSLVKNALFNILGDIEGLTFLDLFAGTGQIGLEAERRG